MFTNSPTTTASSSSIEVRTPIKDQPSTAGGGVGPESGIDGGGGDVAVGGGLDGDKGVAVGFGTKDEARVGLSVGVSVSVGEAEEDEDEDEEF